MSAPRRAKQRDSNEKAIVAAFEIMGFLFVRHDAYDLDILCPRCDAIFAVEVKNGKAGRLTDSQKALLEGHWPLRVVCSVEDALELVHWHNEKEH